MCRVNFIDLRVSVMPALHGESVVIRILDTSAGMKTSAKSAFQALMNNDFVG